MSLAERPTMVSLNGPCGACGRFETLYRNPVGPMPVCWDCLRDREAHAELGGCICPFLTIRGDCPVHGYLVPP